MAQENNIVTTKLLSWAAGIVVCIAAICGYIEARAQSHAETESNRVRSEVFAVRAELLPKIEQKYTVESGIRMESIILQQAETMKSVVTTQADLSKIVEKINLQNAIMQEQLNSLKELVKTK